MSNLTISIDDELVRRARIRALEQGTSVNALVRDYLAAYAMTDPVQRAVDDVLRLAASTRSGSRGQERTWTREDLQER